MRGIWQPPDDHRQGRGGGPGLVALEVDQAEEMMCLQSVKPWRRFGAPPL